MMPAETLQATVEADAAQGRLVAIAAPESAAAGQYRVLYQRILRAAARRPIRTIAVTSAGRREGRTTTAANLALTAAKDGRTTILVEADLRHPSLAALLGLAPRAGLADVIRGTAELGQAVARFGPISVLCAGDAQDAPALLRSERATTVGEQLRAAYDLVVMDAPPALAFADGDRLAAGADAAILVVRAGTTPRQIVRLAVESLGDRAAGIVLNDVDPRAAAHGRWMLGEEALAEPETKTKAG
jgi:capsular exopolysaccharide synthesis family protein